MSRSRSSSAAGSSSLTDVLARTVLSPPELPIGVVTAFFGAPFFAFVLRTTCVGDALTVDVVGHARRDARAADVSLAVEHAASGSR